MHSLKSLRKCSLDERCPDRTLSYCDASEGLKELWWWPGLLISHLSVTFLFHWPVRSWYSPSHFIGGYATYTDQDKTVWAETLVSTFYGQHWLRQRAEIHKKNVRSWCFAKAILNVKQQIEIFCILPDDFAEFLASTFMQVKDSLRWAPWPNDWPTNLEPFLEAPLNSPDLEL